MDSHGSESCRILIRNIQSFSEKSESLRIVHSHPPYYFAKELSNEEKGFGFRFEFDKMYLARFGMQDLNPDSDLEKYPEIF